MWPTFGFLAGLWKPSLTNNENLQHIFEEYFIGRELKRSLIIRAVDLITGDLVIYDEETPMDKMPSVVKGSASIPLFFPPTELDDHAFIDGGTFGSLDISQGIIKCRDKGYKDEDIVVDVIVCFDKVVQVQEWNQKDAKYKNAWKIFQLKFY